MVNLENYEEYMLLYADNELKPAELEALLAFVAAHPELQKELDAYKATQLMPDMNMVFGDKQVLLKTEEPKRTIALGKWTAYAAAAAVLLFAVIIIKQNDTEDTHQPVATTTETIQQPTTKPNDSPKELHSTPVNPVTIENKLADRRSAPVKKQALPKPVAPAPIPQQQKEETYITKEQPKPVEAPKTPVVTPQQQQVVPQQEEQPVVVAQQESPAQEEMPKVTEIKKKRNLLAWLPIRKEKAEGVNMLADAVEERLDKIKKVRNDLKDTDVRFKIGNTELFVVKL